MNAFDRFAHLLLDEQSKVYLQARLRHGVDPSLTTFYRTIRKNPVAYAFRELETYVQTHHPTGWCVWGDDDVAVYHHLVLKDAGWSVAGNYGRAEVLPPDVPALSMEEVEEYLERGYGLLVSNSSGSKAQLSHFPSQKLCLIDHHLVGRTGWQYFDYFQPHPQEIFLDGGSLDGQTTLEFLKWSEGGYEKVFAVEPNPLTFAHCQEQLQGIARVELSQEALWNNQCTKAFQAVPEEKWSAQLSLDGQFQVVCTTIDQLVGDQTITFLKLDVEGAELKALQGAREVIARCKPRMAISVYHKPDDCQTVMTYLHELVPEYRFALRHYHSDCIETILYAVPQ
ncbi:FkbM family methyltransferase [Bengtsoniella intestinalis]|uniref:FkbM family methyltransferase n=1 Tax=Bengtsoniella intestinalis TaxID=3073143 RepID=UPI00391F541D